MAPLDHGFASDDQGYVSRVQSIQSDDDNLVKSARRVMQIFELFGERHGPANATEISHALGFPQSSTSMLLRSLVKLGYLDYDCSSRTFSPTIRISLLGGWRETNFLAAKHILKILDRLHDLTHETVLLGVQSHNCVRIIYVLQSQAPRRFYVPPGTLRPICTTAMGQTLLTLKSETDVRAIVRKVNSQEENPERWVRPAALLEDLEACRRRGFAYTENRYAPVPGSMAAMLLPLPEVGPPMSVGVIATTDRFRANEENIITGLKEVVKAWSWQPEDAA
jgi:DNA-binding IclR family transcriptional regulator